MSVRAKWLEMKRKKVYQWHCTDSQCGGDAAGLADGLDMREVLPTLCTRRIRLYRTGREDREI